MMFYGSPELSCFDCHGCGTVFLDYGENGQISRTCDCTGISHRRLVDKVLEFFRVFGEFADIRMPANIVVALTPDVHHDRMWLDREIRTYLPQLKNPPSYVGTYPTPLEVKEFFKSHMETFPEKWGNPWLVISMLYRFKIRLGSYDGNTLTLEVAL